MKFQNLGHAVNSCYIAAPIAACFAQCRLYDFALSPCRAALPATSAPLAEVLRPLVAAVRRGVSVTGSTVEDLRGELMKLGWPHNLNMQDAVDCFAHLMNELNVPMLEIHARKVHSGRPNPADLRIELERTLTLALPIDKKSVTLTHLLDDYFSNNRIEVRRLTDEGERNILARIFRRVQPKHGLPVPMQILRCDEYRRKRRLRVELPVVFNATRFFENSSPVGHGRFMKLFSAVCHIGGGANSGHYVTYTCDEGVWRRWDDMQRGAVRLSKAGNDGLPSDKKWKEQITRDAYLVFYELLPRQRQGQRPIDDLIEWF